MYKKEWLVLQGINPEPWAIGPVTTGYGKGGGKFGKIGQNSQLAAYQDAIRSTVTKLWGKPMIEDKRLVLDFYFWRRRDDYTTDSQRRHRKHDADLTNMQKATEDALQGIVFANDHDVSEIHSYLMAQGPDVEPNIAISIGLWEVKTMDDLPGTVQRQLLAQETQSSNQWPLVSD